MAHLGLVPLTSDLFSSTALLTNFIITTDTSSPFAVNVNDNFIESIVQCHRICGTGDWFNEL